MRIRLQYVWRTLIVVLAAANWAYGEPNDPPVFSRAAIFGQANLPALVALPVPGVGIALPDDWDREKAPVSIELSKSAPGELSVRRVSKHDGRLYLEIYSPVGPISGTAKIGQAARKLGEQQLDGSLWLSLKPRMARLAIEILSPRSKEPQRISAPASLVECHGRELFLNGEPFLLKGATGQVKDQQQANFVHGLGLNTLRGLGAVSGCEQFGFMNIASLNLGEDSSPKVMQEPDAQFEQAIPKSVEWLKEHCAEAVASPNTLILQLGNEKTGPGNDHPGDEPLSFPRRHVSQVLAAARNFIKPLAPMLPVGYANEDLGFLTPDFMDVYMHNTFLARDRYGYPWEDFMRWQGCLPPDGPTGEGRPFVNSEFGSNRYLCQAYRGGPNNPFLERIHAWNFPQRWAEFMEHGTVGGAIYRLDDLDKPVDQGSSCFGIATNDFKPKLACWEVRHMWRDFEIAVRDKRMLISYKRDYWARDCRLTIAPIDGNPSATNLADFAPREVRTIDTVEPERFRWTIDFTTHSGLINKAAGAWPVEQEESDFLESFKGRDTCAFLAELFDTEVLSFDGKPAPRTLAEMTNAEGVIPVALRKRNGVVYLLLISRESPDKGALRPHLTIDVAFRGGVKKVDEMTGEPLADPVDAIPLPSGLRLTNVEAARIPGPIGLRSRTRFKLPIYRITP